MDTCIAKQEALKKEFGCLTSPEARYQKVMELGKALPKLDNSFKIKENIVKGCQSILYLSSSLDDNGHMHFAAESEALISSGLAALLILIYNGEKPEVVLKCPPSFIEEIGINTALSPGRSNGLYSMHLRMKQEALKFLMSSPATS